jgi:sirohydrochlorin cobaltochelatase
MTTGIMVCGHGSRDPAAMTEFELVAAGLKARLPGYAVETGYLEFARPMIRDGLDALARQGVDRILALPGMLFAASHVKNDLPWEVNSFAADHPDIDVRFGRDLAIEPKLLRAAADRIEEAERAGTRAVARADTLLVTVGRGTTDPDANSNIAKVGRFLWEGMGFGWAEIAFSGVAGPRVAPALRHAVKLGYRRIVVFPYFLFTGVLVKRIYAECDLVAADHPEIEFLKAPYLRDHPLVLDAFLDRVNEMVDGEPAMNCQLCKYRTQILGYEADEGAPQAGHHHHVRGIGAAAGHEHGHGHGQGHGHGHGQGHGQGQGQGHHHDHGEDHHHDHQHGHHHHAAKLNGAGRD